MALIHKLVLVDASNKNKTYTIRRDSPSADTFIAEWGRVDAPKPGRQTYPMARWHGLLAEKKKKGYVDVTELACEKVETDGDPKSQFDAIADAAVRGLFTDLSSYTKAKTAQTYRVAAAAVTPAMVGRAQELLNDLAQLRDDPSQGGFDRFNELLLELFRTIPRKMANVKSHLLEASPGPEEVAAKKAAIIDSEQSALDALVTEIMLRTKAPAAPAGGSAAHDADPLSDLGLAVELLEDTSGLAEFLVPPDGRGSVSWRCRRVFSVVNEKTQGAFDARVASRPNRTTRLLWHGSRNENWLGILSEGLRIRPTGAVHTGSMFGDGLYYADKSSKSTGYTSLSGSHWARGGSKTAYLALYEVHVGEQKVIEEHDRDCCSLCAAKLEPDGYDSVFAQAGPSLRNNEFITYRTDQSTVRYLLEVDGV